MTFEMIEGNPVEVYSFYEKECLMIVYFNFGAMEFPFREKLKKKKKEIEDREDLFTVGFSRTHREIFRGGRQCLAICQISGDGRSGLY